MWLGSDALVLAYMDVDLSTDLDALWPPVAPLMSGHSGELLPLVQDATWFFGTELLVLAERAQLRIHEIPVDWYDDPDSRVDVVSTARDDLRGVWRMRRTLSAWSPHVSAIAEPMGRRLPGAPFARQAASLLVTGVVSTVFHLGLFALLRQGMASATLANAIALLVATIANTSWNRHRTFGLRGREGAGRQQLQALVVFLITLAFTTAGLGLMHAVAPGSPTWVATAAVAVTTALSTAAKFVLMRTWIFAPELDMTSPGGGGSDAAGPVADGHFARHVAGRLP